MKKGILITLLSALAGGLTAYAVVKTMGLVQGSEVVQTTMEGAKFRTVNLSQDNWLYICCRIGSRCCRLCQGDIHPDHAADP